RKRKRFCRLKYSLNEAPGVRTPACCAEWQKRNKRKGTNEGSFSGSKGASRRDDRRVRWRDSRSNREQRVCGRAVRGKVRRRIRGVLRLELRHRREQWHGRALAHSPGAW